MFHIFYTCVLKFVINNILAKQIYTNIIILYVPITETIYYDWSKHLFFELMYRYNIYRLYLLFYAMIYIQN